MYTLVTKETSRLELEQKSSKLINHMKIFVKVKTGSKQNNVEEPPQRLLQADERLNDYYTVSVKELPIEGRANDAVLRTLAEYFNVARSHVRLISGAVSKIKVFEVLR